MEDKYTNPQRIRHRDHHTTDTKDREHTQHISPPAVDSRKNTETGDPLRKTARKLKLPPG